MTGCHASNHWWRVSNYHLKPGISPKTFPLMNQWFLWKQRTWNEMIHPSQTKQTGFKLFVQADSQNGCTYSFFVNSFHEALDSAMMQFCHSSTVLIWGKGTICVETVFIQAHSFFRTCWTWRLERIPFNSGKWSLVVKNIQLISIVRSGIGDSVNKL